MRLNRTLADIRSDIQIRLGFGATGAANITNAPLIDSMIKSGQEQLYYQFDWNELKAIEEKAVGIDQSFYDYPNDCNVDRITSISLFRDGTYWPLVEGIEFVHRNDNYNGMPYRYERRSQLELYPPAKVSGYRLRFEYIKQLTPLVNNNDRTTIPSEIVFLHALTNAKLHYGDADAQNYSGQLDTLLTRLKQSHRKTIHNKTTDFDNYSYVTPEQMA